MKVLMWMYRAAVVVYTLLMVAGIMHMVSPTGYWDHVFSLLFAFVVAGASLGAIEIGSWLLGRIVRKVSRWAR